MSDYFERVKYKGYSIDLVKDENAESPREWDNLGVMFCAHRRYNLGDKQATSREDIDRIENQKGTISLPLYLYDHSGLTMNTTGFSCSWDSGQVGIIYATREKILKEYGGKRVTKKTRDHVYTVLRGEVETYTDYLEGNVAGVIVRNPEDEELDSYWGFFPEHNVLRGRNEYQYAINEGKAIISRDRKERSEKLREQRANRLQALALL